MQQSVEFSIFISQFFLEGNIAKGYVNRSSDRCFSDDQCFTPFKCSYVCLFSYRQRLLRCICQKSLQFLEYRGKRLAR